MHKLAIMLSRIKMDYPEIRASLVEIDDSKLSADDLKAISKQLPTPDEVCFFDNPRKENIALTYQQIGRLQSFEDVKKLARADQYFYQVCSCHQQMEVLLNVKYLSFYF